MSLRDYLFHEEPGITLYHGDCREILPQLESSSVQMCVTSPPYWGLRDYGHPNQTGLEATPEGYVASLGGIMAGVGRALRDDGTLWLNLGDSYTSGGRKERDPGQSKMHPAFEGDSFADGLRPDTPLGLKPKDLVGIPWRVAFALQADGWYLRSDIIWAKPNPMPESVTDRPTKAHEYLFLLAKAERYYYDASAIAEPAKAESAARYNYAFTGAEGTGRLSVMPPAGMRKQTMGKHSVEDPQSAGRRIVESVATARANGADHDSPFGAVRNRRSVWEIATQPFPEAHFATFPEALVKPCILAGSASGTIVLDPFSGAGTVLFMAKEFGRRAIGIEIEERYCEIAVKRLRQEVLVL